MSIKFRSQELINISILLAGILGLMLSLRQGFADSDFYWHIALGETIVKTGSIPREDIFSWIAQEQGSIITAHSWLSGVVLYLFSVIFGGDIGGGFYCVATAIVFDVVVYVLLIRKLQCRLFQNIASALVAWLTVLIFYAGRPQNIGYILYALAIYFLFTNWKKPSWKLVPTVAGISLLLANFHGGTLPMLFAFIALFCIASLVPNWSFGGLTHNVVDKIKCLKIYLSTLGTSLVVGLINPYGFSLYYYFFVTNNTVNKQYVVEWQPSALLFPATLFTLILIFVLFVLMKPAKEFVWSLCLFCTVGMTAIHMRVAHYAAIIAVVLILQVANDLAVKDIRSIPYWIFMSLDAVLLAVVISFSLEGQLWDKLDSPLTEDVSEYLGDKQFERPFTDYDSGGYLIHAGFKSFIDSRSDLFTEDVLLDGFFFGFFAFEDVSEYDRCMKQYNFDSIVIYKPSSYKLRNYLCSRDDWKLDFDSENWAVFIPSTA